MHQLTGMTVFKGAGRGDRSGAVTRLIFS